MSQIFEDKLFSEVKIPKCIELLFSKTPSLRSNYSLDISYDGSLAELLVLRDNMAVWFEHRR